MNTFLDEGFDKTGLSKEDKGGILSFLKEMQSITSVKLRVYLRLANKIMNLQT